MIQLNNTYSTDKMIIESLHAPDFIQLHYHEFDRYYCSVQTALNTLPFASIRNIAAQCNCCDCLLASNSHHRMTNRLFNISLAALFSITQHFSQATQSIILYPYNICNLNRPKVDCIATPRFRTNV